MLESQKISKVLLVDRSKPWRAFQPCASSGSDPGNLETVDCAGTRRHGQTARMAKSMGAQGIFVGRDSSCSKEPSAATVMTIPADPKLRSSF